ncbi:hypothetical protein OROMI_019427 [Orobanche minor]
MGRIELRFPPNPCSHHTHSIPYYSWEDSQYDDSQPLLQPLELPVEGDKADVLLGLHTQRPELPVEGMASNLPPDQAEKFRVWYLKTLGIWCPDVLKLIR